MASLGIVGGCCGNCTVCEAVGFLNPGDGRRFTPSGFGIAEDEGGTITLTLGRNPPCFSYHGTPDDYAAAHSGNYPPIGNEDYFYNTEGSGSFWQKLDGVFSPSGPAPAWGVGAVSVSLAIERAAGDCPHMVPDESQTITWADGDVADKTVELAITCPGPPQYWGNNEGGVVGCGGEVVAAVLTLDDPDRIPCVQIGRPSVGSQAGNGVFVAGACTHDPICSCGQELDVALCTTAASHVGTDQNTVGWHGFTDGATRYLKAEFESFEYTYDPFNPCTIVSGPVSDSGSKWMWNKAECVRATVGSGFSLDIDALDPAGIVDNTHYELQDACGNVVLTIELSEETGSTPETATDADAHLAAALAHDLAASVTCAYACDPPDAPVLDYALGTTGTVADGIVSYRYTTDYTETVMQTTLDTRGLSARPYAYQVEMRTREYEYGGDDGTFGSWVDISNAVTVVDPPATANHGLYAEFRFTELGFHCHPGA